MGALVVSVSALKIERSSAVAGRPAPEPQAVEPDEAFGIMMIVGDGAFLEGDEVGGVE